MSSINPAQSNPRVKLLAFVAAAAAVTLVALAAINLSALVSWGLPSAASYSLVAGGALLLLVAGVALAKNRGQIDKTRKLNVGGSGQPNYALKLEKSPNGVDAGSRDPWEVQKSEQCQALTLLDLIERMNKQWLTCGRIYRVTPENNKLTAFRLAADESAPLNAFPEALAELEGLTYLELTSHQIPAIPRAEEGTRLRKLFERLIELNLSGNRVPLTDLEPLEQFRNLRQLRLANCQIDTWSQDFADRHPELLLLSLANNQLSEPDNLLFPLELTDLDLSGNPLKEVPEEIAYLTQLKSLNLANTDLRVLSDVMEDFVGEKLDLSNNSELTYDGVKSYLRNCKNLRVLHVGGTQITEEQKIALLAEIGKQKNVQPMMYLLLRTPEETSKLMIEVSKWKQEAGLKDEKWPGSLLIDSVQEGVLEEWLRRLRNTQEYLKGNSGKVATIVCSILKVAYQETLFLDYLLGVAYGDVTACGDRAAGSFTEVYNEYLLYTLENGASIENAVPVILAYHRGKELRRQVLVYAEQERMRIWNECGRKKPLGEVQINEIVEVYVYADLQSQKLLRLKLPVSDMLYPDIAKPQWLTSQLGNIQTFIKEMELPSLFCRGGTFARQNPWIRFLKRHPDTQVVVALLDGFTKKILEVRNEEESIDFRNTEAAINWTRQQYIQLYEKWKGSKPLAADVFGAFKEALENWTRGSVVQGIEMQLDTYRENLGGKATVLERLIYLGQKGLWSNDYYQKEKQLIDDFANAFRCWMRNSTFERMDDLKRKFTTWKEDVQKLEEDPEGIIMQRVTAIESAFEIRWSDTILERELMTLFEGAFKSCQWQAGMKTDRPLRRKELLRAKFDEWQKNNPKSKKALEERLKQALDFFEGTSNRPSQIERNNICGPNSEFARWKREKERVYTAFKEWESERNGTKAFLEQWGKEIDAANNRKFLSCVDQIFADWLKIPSDFDMQNDASKYEREYLPHEFSMLIEAYTRILFKEHGIPTKM